MHNTSKLTFFFKVLLGLNLLFAGIGHLTFARIEFLAQVPSWVPLDGDLVVLLSGFVEIIFGLLLLFVWKEQYQKKVGLLVALFFVLIFPGNISQYVNHVSAFGLDTDQARLIRLFFQPVLVIWALLSTGAYSFRKINLNNHNHLLSIKFKKTNGETVSLNDFEAKLFLIVNTASKCGLTYQYEGLQKLHEKYYTSGLQILAFPCNQFLNQEPGSDQEIQEFCSLNFGVQFPIFQKIDVNGKNSHPLYVNLKKMAPGAFGLQSIKWNFTKFLVSKDGKVIQRYSPKINPERMDEEIKKLLMG